MIHRISFGEGNPDLDELEKVPWDAEEVREVEFFKDKFIKVELISIDNSKIKEKLDCLVDGNPIALDLEWKPDKKGGKNPISLFQFCSNKGVLIVTNSSPEGNSVMKDFLQNNRLFGKGMHCDFKKLYLMFGKRFDIEDIQSTWLTPNNISINFEQMIETLVGQPQASFKDKKVSCSDWTSLPLTTKQVLYAAFDSYGLYQAYQTLIKGEFTPGPPPPPVDPTKKREKKPKEDVVSIKSYKPRWDDDVAFRGSEIYDDMKCDMKFTSREEYSIYRSLLENLKARGQIDGSHCNICGKDCKDIQKHCWAYHHGDICDMYFPYQTPKFLARCMREAKFSTQTLERVGATKYKCTVCGKITDCLHIGFTHTRTCHEDLLEKIPKPKPEEIVVGFLRLQGTVTGLECHLCGIELESEEDLSKHCWTEHGNILDGVWKHRPNNYNQETWDEATNLGIDALNKTIYGEIFKGEICCWNCKIGFDSPAELFMHMFHKHTAVRVVYAKDFRNDWPYTVDKFPEELQGYIEYRCFKHAIEEMRLARIIDGELPNLKCLECELEIKTKEEAWKHFINSHIIVQFDPGRPINFEEL